MLLYFILVFYEELGESFILHKISGGFVSLKHCPDHRFFAIWCGEKLVVRPSAMIGSTSAMAFAPAPRLVCFCQLGKAKSECFLTDHLECGQIPVRVVG
jgi:hypothetical protein